MEDLQLPMALIHETARYIVYILAHVFISRATFFFYLNKLNIWCCFKTGVWRYTRSEGEGRVGLTDLLISRDQYTVKCQARQLQSWDRFTSLSWKTLLCTCSNSFNDLTQISTTGGKGNETPSAEVTSCQMEPFLDMWQTEGSIMLRERQRETERKKERKKVCEREKKERKETDKNKSATKPPVDLSDGLMLGAWCETRGEV